MSLFARDVMTKNVKTVGPEMTLAEFERFLLDERISGAPVVADGKLLGVVTRSDIVKQVGVSRALAESALDYYRDFTGIGGPVPGEPVVDVERAAAQAVGERLQNERVRHVMTETLITVPPGAEVREVARLMILHGIHRVLVSEQDRLEGVVTSLDLARLLADGRAVVT